MLNITPPAALQGDERAQLTQVYRYLFQLSEQLNMALGETQKQVDNIQTGTGSKGGIVSEEKLNDGLAKQYGSLRSLIVKTADTVRSEMDLIETRLNSKYNAISKEWGEYKEEISTEIVTTAKETIESYDYSGEVLNIPEMAAEFSAYKIEAEGYIRRGIIGFDEDEVPIIGIAIAQEMTTKEYTTTDGVKYTEVIDTQNMATYTADKLSFWINGVEVAYMSNAELVITRAIISDSIQLGDWLIEVNPANGMSVQKAIGSELDLSENNTITVTADQINAVADDIDLSGNTSITLTAGQINAVADEIDLTSNSTITLMAGQIAGTQEKTNYMEIADDGVYIKDRQGASTLKLNSGSVSIGAVTGAGAGYSQFTANYVMFGNYQLRKSDTDGGLIFKLKG